MKSIVTKLIGLLLAVGLGLYVLAPALFGRGHHPVSAVTAGEAAVKPAAPLVPAVTVVKAGSAPIVESVIVSGTLVPREETMVAAEVDGLAVAELLVEEGSRVEKGQVLARLNRATLEAQLAKNAADIARAEAAIAQSRSQIAEAQATLVSSSKARSRASRLAKSGYGTEATLDQAVSAADIAEARVDAAKKLVQASEADKAGAEALRRELEWKLARTDVVAPTAGLVASRKARIGQIASMAGEPMFRIIAGGEIELEAEVADVDLPRIKQGQIAKVTPAGFTRPFTGTVRLVMPEIDRTTRLGKVRIALDDEQGLTVGGFARGVVEVERREALIVPLSAVAYDGGSAFVQVVVNDLVQSRPVSVGLVDGKQAEVTQGLSNDDSVVVRAGTFLRDGDKVKPVAAETPSASQP